MNALAASAGSAFDDWFRSGAWNVSGKSPTELAEVAWNAAVLAASHECLEYAHSNPNVYRRNVSYACKRRIEALMHSPNALASATGQEDKQ